jgi:hypothetical protein
VRVPRRAIAAAVAAEIEQGNLFEAAETFAWRKEWPSKTEPWRAYSAMGRVAAEFGVNPLALRRVLRGRRYIRGLK